jgi:hypothetical protein
MSDLTIKTAGYLTPDDLHVSVGPVQCGEITDGVCFEHNKDGAWVIDFADLRMIYIRAKQAREGA